MNGDRVDAKLKAKKSNLIQFKRRAPMAKIDFTVNNHGGIVLIIPNTPAGIAWANENIGKDNGFQPYWPTMVFEPRYVDQVIDGIRGEGLTVR
jgi:hypothetical protein